MPVTGRSMERVAIRPSTYGTFSCARVMCAVASGRPNTVNPAGGGSVVHIASMAATFIFWFSPAG